MENLIVSLRGQQVSETQELIISPSIDDSLLVKITKVEEFQPKLSFVKLIHPASWLWCYREIENLTASL